MVSRLREFFRKFALKPWVRIADQMKLETAYLKL
jgi:hypothetical protein